MQQAQFLSQPAQMGTAPARSAVLRLPTALTRRVAAAATLALGLLLLAAQPTMAAPNVTYSKDGVSFEHPAEWKVTEDVVEQDETRMRSIELEGPDEAFITLMFSPLLKGQKIDAFAATTAKNRAEPAKDNTGAPLADQARFGPTTTSAITRNVAGKPNKGVSQRFTVSLQGLTLPHEARFFKAELSETTLIAMTQVADESAKAAEPGFVMALDTLRYQAAPKR